MDTLLGLTALLILIALALLIFAAAVFMLALVAGIIVLFARALWDSFMDMLAS